MRLIITGLAIALLAGCNDLVTINEVGGGAGPMPGNAAAPGAPGAPAAPRPPGARRNSRDAIIEDCTQDLTRTLPRGTDVARLCACAADRMIARVPQRDAARQCAAEQNVRLPGEQ